MQFHPEAQGGPTDTEFLFETFLEMVRGTPPHRVLLEPALYDTPIIRKVLLVGSGVCRSDRPARFVSFPCDRR